MISIIQFKAYLKMGKNLAITWWWYLKRYSCNLFSFNIWPILAFWHKSNPVRTYCHKSIKYLSNNGFIKTYQIVPLQRYIPPNLQILFSIIGIFWCIAYAYIPFLRGIFLYGIRHHSFVGYFDNARFEICFSFSIFELKVVERF